VTAYVATVDGTFAVDLESEELQPVDVDVEPRPVEIALPRVVAGAAVGSTVVAVVDRRPPLMVSHDAGTTWREAGSGLPHGVAVAISDENPDVVVFASRNRLHVSRDGARFWTALAVELPEIRAIELG
jgi:hypothetical protein